MLYMFTRHSTHYEYNACADFAQYIGMDSSITVCDSLLNVGISDFNSIHLFLQ
jgi:hypothetical protein